MSVMTSTTEMIYICHKSYLNSLYDDVEGENSHLCFKCRDDFFTVNEPYKTKNNLNRKSKNRIDLCPNALKVQKIILNLKDVFDKSASAECFQSGKLVADSYYAKLSEMAFGSFKGGNSSTVNVIANINDERYLIPKNCLFYNYDVLEIGKYLNETYDLILLDPPWWNKFIRRKKAKKSLDSYSMMENTKLQQVPVSKLLHREGLVVIWCTNAESHFQALLDKILPSWGVTYIATWFWVKVTLKGDPVTPFSPKNGKQPFERLIFAARDPFHNRHLPEDNKILVSVPSSIHSHKPPLSEVLKPYLPYNPKCLEIFARYLLPNWTSFGNEVLKLQHISFFDEVCPNR